MNDECTICFEKVYNLVVLKCLHSLCKNCLSKLKKQTCPFCRKTIRLNNNKPNKIINRKIAKKNPVIQIKQRHKYKQDIIFSDFFKGNIKL